MDLNIGYACVSSVFSREEKFIDYRYTAYRAAQDLGFNVIRNPEDIGSTQKAFENHLKEFRPVFILLIGKVASDMVKKECKLALELGLHIITLLKTENNSIPRETKKIMQSISKVTFQMECSCFDSCEKLYCSLQERLVQYSRDTKSAHALLIPQHSQVYITASDYIRSAKRRLVICQKTSSLILGARKGVGFEKNFYNSIMNWILSASKEMEFLHIFSLDSTCNALKSPEYDLVQARKQLCALLGQRTKPELVFRGTQDRLVPCVICDNNILVSTSMGTMDYNIFLPNYIMDAVTLSQFVSDLQQCGKPCSVQDVCGYYSGLLGERL